MLLELFKATGGPEWKRKGGWGTDLPICQWEGVECREFFDSNGPVLGLRLRANNLQGLVPISLTTLPRLAILDPADNQLRGDFPETMFDQADANRLELSISGNTLSNLLTKVSLRVDSFSDACVSDARLQLWFEVDGPANRTVYQSARCNVARRRNDDDQFYCAKHEDRWAPALDGVSRALRRLSIASASSQTYRSASGYSYTHSEDLTAKLTWATAYRKSSG